MTKSKVNFVISQGMYMFDLGTQMYRSKTLGQNSIYFREKDLNQITIKKSGYIRYWIRPDFLFYK